MRALQPHLPVLYVSGYSSDLVDSGELEPSEDFLHKPFAPAELGARVAKLLARTYPVELRPARSGARPR